MAVSIAHHAATPLSKQAVGGSLGHGHTSVHTPSGATHGAPLWRDMIGLADEETVRTLARLAHLCPADRQIIAQLGRRLGEQISRGLDERASALIAEEEDTLAMMSAILAWFFGDTSQTACSPCPQGAPQPSPVHASGPALPCSGAVPAQP